MTGSGKTEVYLRAIAHAISLGRRAVLLVPEIALTPQTLERVNAWFEGRVALIHSGQTSRQRFDQWWDIRGGDFDVVVGPRSALFAPLENLGLIVIDEEHEWTYKQEESPPLYHARTAALELARRTGAAIVLGSATPSVESYYYASRGRAQLLSLPYRVGGAQEPGTNRAPEPLPLANVQLCDMREELREGNRSIFSRALSEGLRECLAEGNQAILFLNRRGSSSIVQCRECGHVVSCRRCTTSLTYHSGPPRLLCHQCNYSRRPLDRCPECRGKRIRQLGIGTERVVSEVGQLFPGVRVDRLDSDATRSPGSAEEAVARLSSGETQVLVGTQMVAKGLDVPNVALVGVVLADIGLHVPDFRAGERTFGLLCQVAGRAGRGDAPGRVFVQTYNPGHYAILAGTRQDYFEMYQQEIETRRQLGYPPFNQLAHIVYQNSDAEAVQRQAVAIADELKRRAAAQGRTDIEVSGPAPGLPPRLRAATAGACYYGGATCRTSSTTWISPLAVSSTSTRRTSHDRLLPVHYSSNAPDKLAHKLFDAAEAADADSTPHLQHPHRGGSHHFWGHAPRRYPDILRRRSLRSHGPGGFRRAIPFVDTPDTGLPHRTGPAPYFLCPDYPRPRRPHRRPRPPAGGL